MVWERRTNVYGKNMNVRIMDGSVNRDEQMEKLKPRKTRKKVKMRTR